MLKVIVVNPPTEEQKEQIYKALENLYEGETKDEVQYGQSNEKLRLFNNASRNDGWIQLHICTNDREVV